MDKDPYVPTSVYPQQPLPCDNVHPLVRLGREQAASSDAGEQCPTPNQFRRLRPGGWGWKIFRGLPRGETVTDLEETETVDEPTTLPKSSPTLKTSALSTPDLTTPDITTPETANRLPVKEETREEILKIWKNDDTPAENAVESSIFVSRQGSGTQQERNSATPDSLLEKCANIPAPNKEEMLKLWSSWGAKTKSADAGQPATTDIGLKLDVESAIVELMKPSSTGSPHTIPEKGSTTNQSAGVHSVTLIKKEDKEIELPNQSNSLKEVRRRVRWKFWQRKKRSD